MSKTNTHSAAPNELSVTYYSIHTDMPAQGDVTIIRYIADDANDEFYTATGSDLAEALRNARALVRADIKASK